jgi:hypothetical protein
VMDVLVRRSRQSIQLGKRQGNKVARRATIAGISIAGMVLAAICFFAPVPLQVSSVVLSGIFSAGLLLLLIPDIIPD